MNGKILDTGDFFFTSLLNENRYLLITYENLSSEIKKSVLYGLVKKYLAKYVNYNDISVAKASEYYSNFLSHYNEHCKQFLKSNKYPFNNGAIDFKINREEYDIVLMLSVLFTSHRFRIIQILYENKIFAVEKALFIGLGPGLELYLTRNSINHIDGYDLSINKFLFSEFRDIKINNEIYTGQTQDYYDIIFMIELLEHVEDPYQLLSNCIDSLKSGGRVFLTTATNIPQFDHLINFPEDHRYFENKIHQMGFAIVKKEKIVHKQFFLDMNASNHFYIIEKRFS